ncbi:hypothetical protein C8R43DRAFT_885088 [Mycena crocata]|nr:hypothetical protein C8R43DRAFT_885088 [Mycena crocata]
MIGKSRGVWLYAIPDSNLTVRAFPGDTDPRYGQYYFDIYDSEACRAVNSSSTFSFYCAVNDEQLFSVEETAGFQRSEILDGEERFCAPHGTKCVLKRTDEADMFFRLPIYEQAPFVHEEGLTRPVEFPLHSNL